ncbi:MAG: DUF4255 domain-containing protein [Desertifilum sp.]|nr:DUF4255 domain-containing protein [Desertifilum sp.]
MIPAVAQTLAELLAGETSLVSTEQIDFNHPGLRAKPGPRLNLYCYHIRANHQGQINSLTSSGLTQWFDVSFLVSAWDDTALGEQRLLYETLMSLLQHCALEETHLAPALRGYGNLAIAVSSLHPTETVAIWTALGVPLRPALCVTVTIPVNLQPPPYTRKSPNRICNLPVTPYLR